MLKIWYGRENSDREKFIYESIEKDGGLAMVIVPIPLRRKDRRSGT